MKKSIFIIFLLLISTNLAYANVDSKEENGIPTQDEIIQYLQIYLQTYNGLVETQKEFNNDQFFLYNKTFLINIVISNYQLPNYTKKDPHFATFKGQVAFVFDKTGYNESRYEMSQTNRSIGDLIFHSKRVSPEGEMTELYIHGANILYKNWTIYNSYNITYLEPIGYLYYTLVNDFEFIKPEDAVYSAIYNFNEEYRDLIVKKAQKNAEKNSSYENYYKELNEQNKLIHERGQNGLYLGNRTLFIKDTAQFYELVNKSGLSEKEVEMYSTLPIPKKEFLGIDGFEYTNNLLGYILPVFGLIIFSITIRKILDKMKTKLELFEKWYDMIYLPVLAVFVYSIKPYDIQMYESGTIIIMFFVSAFYILKYEQKIAAK